MTMTTGALCTICNTWVVGPHVCGAINTFPMPQPTYNYVYTQQNPELVKELREIKEVLRDIVSELREHRPVRMSIHKVVDPK